MSLIREDLYSPTRRTIQWHISSASACT